MHKNNLKSRFLAPNKYHPCKIIPDVRNQGQNFPFMGMCVNPLVQLPLYQGEFKQIAGWDGKSANRIAEILNNLN